ncbi:unnamed protein product [Vitrella brassicaformis CCMP3155]|uniref:Serine aminopeptidase S33 domain-containing protein n=1 Tax=Vitrella brassicaformis (strain CCMP3155) TaxID=1169540 RepID=A0A0G4EPD0_VITBC|nr:unnamed protein product [Vitrella brassicaformis CCMP3155]|eukprot:CEL99672.1 unnamed protein product [Vitrella brassicaformis CCMP3155]
MSLPGLLQTRGRPGPVQCEEGMMINERGVRLFTRRWRPQGKVRAQMYLIHGVSFHSGYFGELAAALASDGVDVMAMDLQGHGRSGGTRVHIGRFQHYVDDVRRMIERRRVAGVPVFVFGESMGASIAVVLAIQEEMRVARAERQLFYDFFWGLTCYPYQRLPLAGLILSGTAIRVAKGVFPPKLVRYLLRMLALLLPMLPVVPLDVPSYDEAFRVPQMRKLRLGMVPALTAVPQYIEKNLHLLKVPFLALHGTADERTPPENAHLLYDSSPLPPEMKRVVLYEGASHQLLQDLPETREQVISDIREWVRGRLGE